MRYLLLLSLACPLLAGTAALNLSTARTITVPSSAPYTSMGTEVVTFGLISSSAPGSNTQFLNWHDCLRLSHYTDNTLHLFDSCDGDGSRQAVADLAKVTTTGNYYIVQLQRNQAASTIAVQVWSADRTDYTRGYETFTGSWGTDASGTLTLGATSYGGKVTWVRWSSTGVEDQEWLYPAEYGTSNVDYWDFRDSTLAGNVFTWSGTGSYGTLAATNPTCIAAQNYTRQATATVGTAFTFDPFAAALNGTSTLTYSWSRLSGPNTPTLSSSSALAPSLTGHVSTVAAKQSYRYRLTVTDSEARTATCDVELGAVALDSYGNSDPNDWPSGWYALLGPVPAGDTPSSYFNHNERAILWNQAQLLADSANLPARGSSISCGTLTVTQQYPVKMSCTNSVTGGFNLCPAMDPSGCVAGTPVQFLFAAWTTEDGAGTGNYLCDVETIISATAWQCRNYNFPSLIGSSFPLTMGALYNRKAESGLFTWSLWSSDSNSINYYDGAAAHYRYFAATGLDTYLTSARTLAENFYNYTLDHGSNVSIRPRALNWKGVAIWAKDTSHNIWDALAFQTDYALTAYGADSSYIGGRIDREVGSYVGDIATAAQLHPTQSAHFCTMLQAQSDVFTTTGVWTMVDSDHGIPIENTGRDNPGLIYAINYARPGNSMWRFGWNTEGMRDMEYALRNACSDSTRADAILNLIRVSANIMWTDGIYNDPGHTAQVYGDNNYGNIPQLGVAGTGTISGTAGATTITTSADLRATDACDGTHFIAPSGEPSRGAWVAYPIASCTATTATIAGGRTVTTSFPSDTFQVTPSAERAGAATLNSSLFANTVPYVSGGLGEDLTREIDVIYAYLATKYPASSATWMDRAIQLWVSMAGGSKSGPGTWGLCDGPDGYTCSNVQTDWRGPYPYNCATDARPPCYNGDTYNLAWKNPNEALGELGGRSFWGWANTLSASPAPTPSTTITGTLSISGTVSIQ